jgi:hypothetical protein
MQLTRKLADASDETLASLRDRIGGVLECEQHLGGDILTALFTVIEKVQAEQARRGPRPPAP